MTSASIAQVASATAALCGAAGVTYYAVNVAKVFGGARRGEGDANGRARAIEGGRGATLRTGERTRASARGGSIDASAREGVGTDDGRARASRRSVAVDDDEGVGRRDEGAHEGVAARGERDARRAGTDG